MTSINVSEEIHERIMNGRIVDRVNGIYRSSVPKVLIHALECADAVESGKYVLADSNGAPTAQSNPKYEDEIAKLKDTAERDDALIQSLNRQIAGLKAGGGNADCVELESALKDAKSTISTNDKIIKDLQESITGWAERNAAMKKQLEKAQTELASFSE